MLDVNNIRFALTDIKHLISNIYFNKAPRTPDREERRGVTGHFALDQ